MKTILFFIISLFSLSVSAQIKLVNQVVSMSGVEGRTSNFIMSATAGETVIGLTGDAQRHLTQGFQQNLQTLTTSSISWEPLEVSLQIFPNPSSGSFQLLLERPIANLKYTLIDLIGRPVKRGIVNGVKVKFEDLTNGSYLLLLHSGTSRRAEKIQIIK